MIFSIIERATPPRPAQFTRAFLKFGSDLMGRVVVFVVAVVRMGPIMPSACLGRPYGMRWPGSMLPPPPPPPDNRERRKEGKLSVSSGRLAKMYIYVPARELRGDGKEDDILFSKGNLAGLNVSFPSPPII